MNKGLTGLEQHEGEQLMNYPFKTLVPIHSNWNRWPVMVLYKKLSLCIQQKNLSHPGFE